MTQSQTTLYNAAEAALNEARCSVCKLYDHSGKRPLVPSTEPLNQRPIDQALLKIDEALLWLREI